MFSSFFSLIAKPTSSKTFLPKKQINKPPEKNGLTLSLLCPQPSHHIPGMGIWGAGSNLNLGSPEKTKQARLWNTFCFPPVLARAGEDVCGPSPWMM